MGTNNLRIVFGTAVVVLALALAPAAVAQNSSAEGYGGSGGAVAGVSEGGDAGSGNTGAGAGAGTDAGSGSTADSGTLPFTGLDMGLLAGGGVLLLMIGVGMAKLAGRRPFEAS